MFLMTHKDEEGREAVIYQSIFPDELRDKPVEELMGCEGKQDCIAFITTLAKSNQTEVWTGKREEFNAQFKPITILCPNCKNELNFSRHLRCDCGFRAEYLDSFVGSFLIQHETPHNVRTMNDTYWLITATGIKSPESLTKEEIARLPVIERGL